MGKKNNILSYVFWGIVAVVLVYFCLRSVDWAQFWEALKLCKWSYVLLSMVIGAFVLYLRAVRWRMLMLPIDPGTSRITCFNSYNICMAVNLALPRAGEVVKLGYIVRHSTKDADGHRLMTFDKSLGTLLIERIWDAVVALSMFALLLVVKWDVFGALIDDYSSAGFRAGLWWILGGTVVLLGAFVFVAWRLQGRGGVWAKVWGFICGIGHGLSSFAHMNKAWLFLLETAVIWALYWVMSACVIWALRDIPAFSGLNMTDAFFLSIIGSISSVVPVPGGFGAYHGVVAGALLSIWNIPLGTGMIFATLAHESQALTQALCGLLSYLHESFVRK